MTAPPQKVSARDEKTILRLRRKMGQHGLIRYIQSLSDKKVKRKPPGAPRMTRATGPPRGALSIQDMPKAYDSFRFRETPTSSRRNQILPSHTPDLHHVQVGWCLEADLRRGLQVDSEKDLRRMVDAMLFWRFFHVNPFWPNVCGPRPHLLITPRKPAEMIGWIDAAIKLSGVPDHVIKQRFTIQK